MKNKVVLLSIFFILSVSVAFDGAKYLIISPDNFVSAVQPLADWKTQKGIKALVVPMSVTGSYNTQIRNYILNAYNSWRIRPEYILLVGSGGVLPSWNIGNGDYSDDFYADLTGNLLIELSIGRIPCTTVNQCNNIVNKIISYEKTPYMTDTTWFRKGTTIVREDQSTHPDTIYWNNIRYVHSFWRNCYTKIDSFSRQRGDHSSDVVNSINNGRAFVVYRGEATVNWYNPFQINVNQTSNGYKLPIIISGTCGTISLSQSTDYLGDQMLNYGTVQTPKAAVAFFGSSVSTSGPGLAALRGTATMGFFTALYRDNIYKLGDATKRAKFILDSLQLPYYNDTRYHEWNLYGDPEMSMWTAVPKQLTVVHDTAVQTIPRYYSITVREASTPIVGALVCLMIDTVLYEQNYTNSSGQTSFLIYPHLPDTMYVTVTAQGYKPYQKKVIVRQGSLDHDVGVISIVEPRGTIAAGINILPKVKVKNFGTHTDTFPVTFKIGTVYNQTISSIILAPNETTIVSFPSWTTVMGNYQVTAFTSLTVDQWCGDDSAISSVNIIYANDIGVEAILSPDSSHRIGVPMLPKARIKNYGAFTQTNFTVTCSIINSEGVLRYSNSQSVSSLAPNDTLRINFTSWTPNVAELCTVKIRTNLIGDENTVNDQKIRLTFMFTAISEETQETQVKITSLNAIKPNPMVNGYTHISFSISQATHTTLNIYNVAGGITKTFVDGNKNSGMYTYIWDGRDEQNKIVPEGIYFCTLETPEQNYTKKLILTR